MNNLLLDCTIFGKSATLERISKPAARKLWGNTPVVLCPCKMYPCGDYSALIEPERLQQEHPESASFNAIVNSFEYYNCNNETGKTASFYKVTYKEI